MNRRRFLRQGSNCWRIARARRAAFLVDGDAYYRAFRSAVLNARQSVLIAGWDIDSRVRLARDGPADGLPSPLGQFLKAVVKRRKGLHVYVLAWDYAMLYAFEREWLPIYRLPWGSQRRLHFHMDGDHPFEASHHQKIVVVDDAVGFVGGIDLSIDRWDARGHDPGDHRRVNPEGQPYGPRHDVQMAVTGDAARALGELVRERWLRSAGARIPPPEARPDRDWWPLAAAADLEDIDVGIARTDPAYDGRPEVREVEQLYVDSFSGARRFVYVEQQYLTCDRAGEVLARRLAEPDGPEIVIVLPVKAAGWLEQRTMDVLRSRLLEKLRHADRHGRLRIYSPCVLEPDKTSIYVHSKVTVVDDDFVRVGSSNLSNRSMGLDTECDLAVDADGDNRIRQAIAAFRNRLLGEHLGVEPRRVQEATSQHNSLIRAIESLRGGRRSLENLPPSRLSDADPVVLDPELLDSGRPVDMNRVAEELVPKEDRRTVSARLVVAASLLVLFVAVAAAWRWTPLREWIDVGILAAGVERFRGNPLAPFLVVGAFLLAGLLVVPVTACVVATLLAFGPWPGIGYALLGAGLSACLMYAVGRYLDEGTVRRISGSRLGRVARRLSKRGVLTIVAVRMIPVAPYSLVNVMAGASRFRFRDFAIGTVLGMAPGIAVLAVLLDRLETAVRTPDSTAWLLLALASAAVAALLFGLRAWLQGGRPAARKSPNR